MLGRNAKMSSSHHDRQNISYGVKMYPEMKGSE